MKDLITKLLSNADTALMFIVIVVISINVILTALKKVLDKVKDLTPTDADNKAADVVGKILGVILKILEFASANSSALPPKAKKELEESQPPKVV